MSREAHVQFCEGLAGKFRWSTLPIVGFQHREEAMRFYQELSERMRQFGLILHPEKTRILRFGRYASEHCKKEGRKKPETFDFLGFTHYCTKARRNGWYVVGRKTVKKRMRAKLMAIKQELRKRLHAPIPETGGWLNTELRGHLNYFAVPGNGKKPELLLQTSGIVLDENTTETESKEQDKLGEI